MAKEIIDLKEVTIIRRSGSREGLNFESLVECPQEGWAKYSSPSYVKMWMGTDYKNDYFYKIFKSCLRKYNDYNLKIIKEFR